MANPKNAAWYGGAVSLITGEQPSMGSAFYVSSSGADTNAGTRDAPFLTITAAIAACTAGADDYIFVLGYAGAAAGETWPIPMATSKVHLIGTPGQANPSPLLTPPGDTNAIDITASNCEVSGLEIAAGATGAGINISGVTWKTHIHDCWFAWQGTGQDGIRLSAGTDDAPSAHIHDNYFGMGLTRNGVRVVFNSTRSIIEDNIFADVPSGAVGILVVNEFANGVILNNVFQVADAANGEAITLPATCNNAMVHGNYAMQGVVAMANTAFRDLGANHWGWNASSITAALPVTV
jgi:hypothetical protein